ncbi:MAG: carbamoyl-phosphate synthase large subunit, partial [Sandaracinaceae bacterium]|nr:carbamoyl-phosphate synthase large subunit [Sandaracinaceae bacterium]
AEDRELFKRSMEKIGLEVCRARTVRTLDEAEAAVREIGFPVILRPSFTLGGSGGGMAYNRTEFEAAIRWAFAQSPIHECLIEESIVGWKEFELEVMRDAADNFSVICTIENVDPMGIHTGDSITVAPAMTLTDKEFQRMRDAARAIMTEIGVETGGANIQFAVDPETGRMVVVEMNPRVSRSSALASKATGYPIARIAAKLAVGYRLDELRSPITGTSAAFEPTIDYVVVKWPRFAFEKFRGADPRLTTQMKSVGEAMAIGKTFAEALQKAARSLEIGRDGLVSLLDRVHYVALASEMRALRQMPPGTPWNLSGRAHVQGRASPSELREAILELLTTPLGDRMWFIADAFRVGATLEEVRRATKIDPWFLEEVRKIVRFEQELAASRGQKLDPDGLRKAKALGFSDRQIAHLRGERREDIEARRRELEIERTYARVDTCAAEFEAHTPYLYSTWGKSCEARPSGRKKVLILGGGPNRIGQGIEFDYCCVHAAFALKELGFETIMVNCNPETVSTDFDTSDRLYFEPLTLEDVLAIVEVEKPMGVIVQYGGQTPLKLAIPLARAQVPILGTPAASIDRAEDREQFDALLAKLGLRRPLGGIARDVEEAYAIAERIGYPVLVRPSYVLGGRAMEIVRSQAELREYFASALQAVEDAERQTILVDQFLEDALEVDVDCISDGKQVVIGGILQHIEEAGVHSGDSSMVLPPHALPPEVLATIRSATRLLAMELGVVGLMNVQFAVRGSAVYVLEVNPRASRTVPFVSKAIGVPLAKLGAKVMVGKTLSELGFTREVFPPHVAVKESVFPFNKFPGVDILLGPEMRSTGEVMGIASDFPMAFAKAQIAAGARLPKRGRVFLSVRDSDKPAACELGRCLHELGYEIVATRGTQAALARAGVPARIINKVHEGRPHIVDALTNGEIDLVINTTERAQSIRDSYSLRRQTLLSGIPYCTTIAAAAALVQALGSWRESSLSVRSLQEYHAAIRKG